MGPRPKLRQGINQGLNFVQSRANQPTLNPKKDKHFCIYNLHYEDEELSLAPSSSPAFSQAHLTRFARRAHASSIWSSGIKLKLMRTWLVWAPCTKNAAPGRASTRFCSAPCSISSKLSSILPRGSRSFIHTNMPAAGACHEASAPRCLRAASQNRSRRRRYRAATACPCARKPSWPQCRNRARARTCVVVQGWRLRGVFV